jgi:hypothetical protein
MGRHRLIHRQIHTDEHRGSRQTDRHRRIHWWTDTYGYTDGYRQMGTGAISLGVKRPGLETDLSPASSAEAKNASLPQYVLLSREGAGRMRSP